jgi:amidohydrolase
MEAKELKASAIVAIDAQSQQLKELALRIHKNPELGLQELKASEWISEYLETNDFSVERGIAGLQTAFKASYGNGKPAIAFLAEYDALPEIGHGCGHNLIATAALGAGIATRMAADQLGSSVLVIGTPAEESYGGKVIMTKKGIFDGLDATLMVHPGDRDIATARTLALQDLDVEFFGKAAHAASKPEEGINALEALLISFNAINSLRQHIKGTARIHGVITHGGEAANIVPAYSSAHFMTRADDDAYLDELNEKVIDCFRAGAKATGARLEYKWDESRYSAMRNNMSLAQLYIKNMESLGRKVALSKPEEKGTGSSDTGNVSQVVPSIQPVISIAEPELPGHSLEFAQAAASEMGTRGMLDAAKALALTAVDLLAEPENLAGVKREFEQGS